MHPLKISAANLSAALLAILTLAGATPMAPIHGADASPAEQPARSASAAVEDIEVQGRVICLPEVMHQKHGVDLSAEHEHIYGFQTEDGTLYTLLRAKFSEALFLDPALREKTLLLKGRLFPKSHVFEPIRIRSVRDGVVYDVFYYCTVCSIESVSPAPCACCQDPVELKERPLRDRSDR